MGKNYQLKRQNHYFTSIIAEICQFSFKARHRRIINHRHTKYSPGRVALFEWKMTLQWYKDMPPGGTTHSYCTPLPQRIKWILYNIYVNINRYIKKVYSLKEPFVTGVARLSIQQLQLGLLHTVKTLHTCLSSHFPGNSEGTRLSKMCLILTRSATL